MWLERRIPYIRIHSQVPGACFLESVPGPCFQMVVVLLAALTLMHSGPLMRTQRSASKIFHWGRKGFIVHSLKYPFALNFILCIEIREKHINQIQPMRNNSTIANKPMQTDATNANQCNQCRAEGRNQCREGGRNQCRAGRRNPCLAGGQNQRN